MSTTEVSTASQPNAATYLGWAVLVLALSLPLYRPWVSMSTVLILLIWVAGGQVRKRLHALKHSRLSLAVLVFVGINLVSLLWSDSPAEGFRYTKKYWYLFLIPVLASALPPVFRRAATTVFSAAAAVSATVSIAVFAGVVKFGDAHPSNPSPMMHHIDYSLILALGALLILNRLLNGGFRAGHRALWIFGLAVVVSGLAVNVGRSGHLAFLGGIVTLIAYWSLGRSPRAIAAAAAVFLVAVITVWYGVPRARERVTVGTDQVRAALVEGRYDGSMGGRVAATIVAQEIFRSHPLIGTGVGDNMPEFRRILETEDRDYSFAISWYPHFHSQYAQIATELGLLGLLSLAWIFWELVRGPSTSREFKGLALALAAAYLLGFLGEPYLHKQMTLVAFALFAGLIAGDQLDGATDASGDDIRDSDGPTRSAGVAAG